MKATQVRIDGKTYEMLKEMREKTDIPLVKLIKKSVEKYYATFLKEKTI